MKSSSLFFFVSIFAVSHAHAVVDDETYLRSVIKNESRLIVIGEWHEDPEVTAEEVRAISLLKKMDPAFDCFFSELDQNYAERFQPFNEGASTYEQTIGLAFEEFEKAHGPSNNLLPKALAEGVRSAGLRIVPVDIAWDSVNGKTAWRSAETRFNSGRSYLEHRTQVMAQAVTREMKSGRCQKAVFVVGDNHIYKTAIENGPVHTLQDDFALSGLAIQYFKVSKLDGDATPILPPVP